MATIGISIKNEVSSDLYRLLKKAGDLSKPMRKIRRRVLIPLRNKTWARSRLKSRTGELEKSVVAWSGKKSAGISVHTKLGKDLIMPKATTHMYGRKRGTATRKRSYRVLRHRRRGRAVAEHRRRNAGTPWGDIPARPFIPQRFSETDKRKALKILEDFLDV